MLATSVVCWRILLATAPTSSPPRFRDTDKVRSRVREMTEFDYFNPFESLPFLEALLGPPARLPVGVARQRANNTGVANNPPTRHVDAA